MAAPAAVAVPPYAEEKAVPTQCTINPFNPFVKFIGDADKVVGSSSICLNSLFQNLMVRLNYKNLTLPLYTIFLVYSLFVRMQLAARPNRRLGPNHFAWVSSSAPGDDVWRPDQQRGSQLSSGLKRRRTRSTPSHTGRSVEAGAKPISFPFPTFGFPNFFLGFRV